MVVEVEQVEAVVVGQTFELGDAVVVQMQLLEQTQWFQVLYFGDVVAFQFEDFEL